MGLGSFLLDCYDNIVHFDLACLSSILEQTYYISEFSFFINHSSDEKFLFKLGNF